VYFYIPSIYDIAISGKVSKYISWEKMTRFSLAFEFMAKFGLYENFNSRYSGLMKPVLVLLDEQNPKV